MHSNTYLGFDFGLKFLGVAVGQSITQTAQPLATLKMLQGEPNWEQLDPLIKEWQPKALIVGLALQPDGTHSKTSTLAEAFGHSLEKRYERPVYFIDERLTTVAARDLAKTLSRSCDKRKGEIDRISAAIILESWLNSGNHTSV